MFINIYDAYVVYLYVPVGCMYFWLLCVRWMVTYFKFHKAYYMFNNLNCLYSWHVFWKGEGSCLCGLFECIWIADIQFSMTISAVDALDNSWTFNTLKYLETFASLLLFVMPCPLNYWLCFLFFFSDFVKFRYEKELMHPIQNLLSGELARALLIQVLKASLLWNFCL